MTTYTTQERGRKGEKRRPKINSKTEGLGRGGKNDYWKEKKTWCRVTIVKSVSLTRLQRFVITVVID